MGLKARKKDLAKAIRICLHKDSYFSLYERVAILSYNKKHRDVWKFPLSIGLFLSAYESVWCLYTIANIHFHKTTKHNHPSYLTSNEFVPFICSKSFMKFIEIFFSMQSFSQWWDDMSNMPKLVLTRYTKTNFRHPSYSSSKIRIHRKFQRTLSPESSNNSQPIQFLDSMLERTDTFPASLNIRRTWDVYVSLSVGDKQK